MQVAGIILLVFLMYFSLRTALVDYLAESGRPGNLEKAISMDPENTRYRLAVVTRDLSSNSVSRSRVVEELRQLLIQSPRNSDALMNLGLLEEAMGNIAEAERYLKEAAANDHTYKPSWTIANFYFRTNAFDKMWPYIRRAIDVTTRQDKLHVFDLIPLYDLCWRTGTDPHFLLTLVPERENTLITYFQYLAHHGHIEVAIAAFPRAIQFATAAIPEHRAIFVEYIDLLFREGRAKELVETWNQLVAKKIILSTEVHPERAAAVTNPEFEFPLETSAFGWRGPAINDQVQLSYTPHSIVFNISGKQPDAVILFEKNIAILPGKDYFLTWTADGSEILKPADLKESGIAVKLSNSKMNLPMRCSLFFAEETKRGCHFQLPAGPNGEPVLLTLRLVAERVTGSVRLRGAVRVTGFRLTFANGVTT